MGDRWYLALLVLRSPVDGGPASRLPSDLRYRIFRAHDPEDAYAKALALGKCESSECQDDEGENIGWDFLGLRDLCDVTDAGISDDAEVRTELVSGLEDQVVPKEQLTVFRLQAGS